MDATTATDGTGGTDEDGTQVGTGGGMTTGWLPIASAPKDGTEILVTDGTWVGEVRWQDSWYNDPDNPGWMLANCDEEYGHYVDATHWQPLPPHRKPYDDA